MPDKIHALLNHWFGDLGVADLPTSDRTNLWFGEDNALKEKITNNYLHDYQAAVEDKLADWRETPRGCLALIILLDQFSRYVHRNSVQAFENDKKAQELALQGIELKMDLTLTLIERVFFYMPLVHAEDAAIQEHSIRLFQSLVGLSMPETVQVYQLFLAYAYAHFRVVKEFGRFPQRNTILGRKSTDAEIAFLKSS